jgi:hypothetical protein
VWPPNQLFLESPPPAARFTGTPQLGPAEDGDASIEKDESLEVAESEYSGAADARLVTS